jgi:diguanylate cyclase (GGDEF)-like protein
MARTGGKRRQPRHRDDQPFRGNHFSAVISAALSFLVVVTIGETMLGAYLYDQDGKRHLDSLAQASVLRAKVESELNSILYLSSGLGGYLTVRNDSMDRREINDILAALYRSSRHVRNFGIAIGYRITYIHPICGNEQAIGLNYPDQADQWPIVRKVIDEGKPVLAGPVDLVQGGRGVVFRVPLTIGGKYWGLLSTVIDSDTMFSSVNLHADQGRYRFALRGKDGSGRSGGAIWGDMAIFDEPEAVIQDIDVPGGLWAIAVKPTGAATPPYVQTMARMVSMVLGALVAWLVATLIRNRSELARNALYDTLTGLPNRVLLEDRAEMAFARQQRNPEQLCALVFFDLDGFKEINDEYGHKAGDAVLKITATRAKAAVRSNDTVARWGGDEFIVLLENVTSDLIETLTGRLRTNLQTPVEFEGQQLGVGISIGVAVHPVGGSLDETLKTADQRMYDEKLARRTAAA